MPQYDYTPPIVGLPGQRASTRPAVIASAIYPKLAQVTTLSVGATPTDGLYQVVVQGPHGTSTSDGFTASSSTQAQVAAGIAADINASASYKGIATATADATSVTVTFVAYDTAYTVSVTQPSTDVTVALTVDPTQPLMRPGIAVLKQADGTLRPATTGDTAATIDGVSMRTEEIAPQKSLSFDGYESGAEVAYMQQGDLWVEVEDAVTAKGQCYVRLTATGTEVEGAFRSDADGGDAIAIKAQYIDTAAAGGMARVLLLAMPSL